MKIFISGFVIDKNTATQKTSLSGNFFVNEIF